MKLLRYLLVLLTLIVFNALRVYSQGFDIQPKPICAGGQATFIVDLSQVTKSVDHINWYYGDGRVGVTNTSPIDRYTWNPSPVGNYTGKATIYYSATDSFVVTPLAFTVYNKPIANFYLDPTVNDTQCFAAGTNSFCFINTSQTGALPSNNIAKYLWFFGDGDTSTLPTSPVCHSFGFSSKFNVTLRVTDDKGCFTDIINPSSGGPGGAGGIGSGIVVVPNTPPDFDWVPLPSPLGGPCFKSCYKFRNHSVTAINQIQYYQWDFGDGIGTKCSTLETDSNQYTAFYPFNIKDPITNIFDSSYYDTIIHCYCTNGEFNPKLTIKNSFGCVDSTLKTPSNVGGNQRLPYNIKFEFDIVTSKKDLTNSNELIIADSVCAGSRNSATICFKQTPISFAQVGAGDFVWFFGDPNDPNLKDVDSTTWTPCHTYSGMGSFFPSLTIKNVCPDTTFFYYSATTIGPYQRYIDTLHDKQDDLYDQSMSFDLVPPGYVKYAPYGPFDESPALDGQSIIINGLDSVPMVYVGMTIVGTDTTFIYKPIPSNQYIGDSLYKIKSTTIIYKYYDSVPEPRYLVWPDTTVVPPIPGVKYKSIKDSLLTDVAAVMRVRNPQGNVKDTLWYIFSRSYKYGVRILGPAAQIENPPAGITITSSLKNQCGPRDTVDFVDATALSPGFKARNVWRRWDFDDDYAPQCTSFSVPQPGWPQITAIDSAGWWDPVTNQRRVRIDTTRSWRDALEQYRNSDHYFISSGQTYPGKRNCRFSHDTLPRHLYPNWDTVYLWYRYGHDFMPWDTTRWTRDPSLIGPTTFAVKDWDTMWWGKPIYLNAATGAWSLTPGFSYYPSLGLNVPWPRIDTMRSTPTPIDRWPGNGTQNGLPTNTPVPDPYQLTQGSYYMIRGYTIDTIVHVPPRYYQAGGKMILLPDGKTPMPGGSGDFFEYVFRRTVQKCYTVRLKLTDSLNNESGDSFGAAPPIDITRLDMWDCTSEATVQLALGKPDARGMGKRGKECPGKDPTGNPALIFNNSVAAYPGMQLPCGGRTSIYINIDSLADRMDGTPCYLDAFTTWGVGTPGTQIAPGPGINITPGGLTRQTFYTRVNFNPLPPSPWTGAGGTVLQYQMGGNSPTPPAADTLMGMVTIGIYIGNGVADSALDISAPDFRNNTYNGLPLKDYYGNLSDPTDPLNRPYKWSTLPLIKPVRNLATPPPVPIPSNWKDDSVNYNFFLNKILRTKYVFNPLTSKFDTIHTVEFLDPNWSKCMSDTIWYHNFWHIKELDPTFYKSPADLSTLRERFDTLTVVYRDSIQDSVHTTVWTWADQTATVDSFYYAGSDTTDGYYTLGVRRVRYNFDFSVDPSGVITDSIVWPCGVYGDRRFMLPVRFYKRIFDSIGYIAPDSLLILRSKCPTLSHDATGIYPDTIRMPAADTTNLPPDYRRIFNVIGMDGSDILLFNKCPYPSHYSAQLSPYSNYFDTIYLPIKDTMRFTQYQLIDTALFLMPVQHVYKSTSWEIGDFARQPGSNNTEISLYMENTQHCQYTVQTILTIGVIDTLHIYDASGKEDTIFCKNEPIYFSDSVGYYRFDNSRTFLPPNPDGDRNGPYNAPYDAWYIDTTDFWWRDASNPSDSIGNNSDPVWLNKSLFEFKYYPGKWTHWDENGFYYTQAIGHWDLTIRGGDVPVLFPSASNDPYNTVPQVGTIMFFPGENPGVPTPPQWGARRGLYSWTSTGNWSYINNPQPAVVNALNSYTDGTVYPGPGVLTPGRSLIFNDGKGAIKRVGMYYWDGARWQFICNSRYTTFPYVTHRLYWDFGDGSPIHVGVKPVHKYATYGRYKVTMVSRDSVGAFDTCISFVQIVKPVSRPHVIKPVISCTETGNFLDMSYVLSGLNDTNNVDKIVSINWWFNLKYSYPNGLQGQDTITPQSVLTNPTWYYTQKGTFKVKLSILTEQGCADTATDSIVIKGPRPAFRLLSDTIGCKPYTVQIWNMADSFDMVSPSDTPTRTTIISWGDGQNTAIKGRRDTVSHTYANIGTYYIIAAGRDTDEFSAPSCPIVFTPDTVDGFQKPIIVTVRQPYRTEIVSQYDTVCVGQVFNIANNSDSLSYSQYRFERRIHDSVYTFIDSTIMNNTAPLITHFDTMGLYNVILFPIDYQASVPLSARCAIQDTVLITALKPKADFTIDTTGFPEYKFKNTSVGASHYDWVIYEKDGITVKSEKLNAYPPGIDWQFDLKDDTGRFQVCLTAYITVPGGTDICPDKHCDYINNIYTTKVVIPNVYTPNEDGHNDFFKIDIENETKYELTIFNRWGTKVFTSDKKDNMWNGKNNNDGSECSSGTYFFVFTYKLRGQEEKTVHGTITLIKGQ